MRVRVLNKNRISSTTKEQISTLFKQLSPNKIQLDLNDVLSTSDQITIAYCEENDEIIGIATMCTYKVISGHKGWIEDVVVDSNHRNKGIGRMLINVLLESGEKKGLSEILLFTEDYRVAAINLYSQLGFKPKDSRLFYRKL